MTRDHRPLERAVDDDAADSDGASADVGTSGDDRRASRRTALVRTAISVLGVGLAVTFALVARSMRPEPPLPVFAQMPDFHLVDERGAAFTSKAMLGHVSVVDFVFTRCPTSCPRLTARMGELQSRFEGERVDAHLVSFSVDPENDTPAVLAAYAARAHADPSRWSFLTGPAEDVTSVVVKGFKIAALKGPRQGDQEGEVIHGEWFVLVDRKGAIRGYYPTTTDEEVETVIRDTKRLERERGA